MATDRALAFGGPSGLVYRVNALLLAGLALAVVSSCDRNCAGCKSVPPQPPNREPAATAQSVTTPEDSTVEIQLAGTDTDGSVVGYRIVDQPQHGTLTGTAPALSYTPAADFNGADSFSFVVIDNRGAESNPAQVSIEVTPVNDVPVATSQDVDVAEDSSVVIELSGTDIDGTIVGYEVVADPGNGVLSGDLPNVTYTPDSDYNGTDGFSFRVTDDEGATSEPARLSIDVTPVNDPPVAVAQNLTMTDEESINIVLEGTDVDGTVESHEIVTRPESGTLTGTPPEMAYTPNAGFSGPDAFTFSVTDNAGATSTPAAITIEVMRPDPCPDDRHALETLYNTTSGDSWRRKSGWLLAEDLGDWYGLQVEDGCVVGINLRDNRLQGTLPWQLGNLRRMRTLELSGNSLSGAIPVELGSLSDLGHMGIGQRCDATACVSNALTGEIPWELGNLANLRTLRLEGNQLTGGIPRELSRLARLEWMNLAGNQLSGSIPDEIGDLASLEHLDLAGNSLTGSIPQAIGAMTRVNFLSLADNRLTGTIPVELGNLANLRHLYLTNNSLSGGIPTWLRDVTRLVRLHLSGNELAGPIPVELAELESLESLSLAENRLTGGIPGELGGLSHLRFLVLHGNGLSGTVPVEIADLTKARTLTLERNRLAGQLPGEMTRMTELQELRFHENDGLCAPADEDFQAWLRGVDGWSGPTCD